jgi:hypothetical protein
MAAQSLSPKQIAERTQLHRQAVMILADRRAKKAIEAELRSKGIRTTLIRPAEINLLARDYLAQHQERLRAEAEHAIATWPGFARWRLPKEVFVKSQEIEHSPNASGSPMRPRIRRTSASLSELGPQSSAGKP